jgi:hypothetical protein
LADLVGKTVRLPPELWEKLAERAKADERSVNYVITQAVKAHVGQVVPDVGKAVSSQYHDGTAVVSTPDSARARESSVLPSFLPDQKEEEGEKEPPDASAASPPDEPEFVRIARAIRELDWLGATLANGETPEALADKMLHAFPDVNVLRMVYKAAAVLPERNRKKKSKVRRLGSYLLNFMENEDEPPAWKQERRRQKLKTDESGQIDLNDLFEFKEDVDRMNAEQRRREGRDD